MPTKKANIKPKARKSKIEEWLDNPQRVLVAGAIVGIGGYLTYKLIRFIYSSIRSNSTSRQADDDPNVRAAMTMHTAMNPSGISWMRSFDLTNDEAIFNAAKTITDLDAVIKAYRKLYDSDMMTDLQSELNADEYQKLLNIITSNPNKQGGSDPVTWAKKLTMIVAKKDVTLRKTPDASYHGSFYENDRENNIISVAGPGTFIGYATGVQQFDSKNNVKFIQAAYIVKKEGVPAKYKQFAGKKSIFWVSASADYVDLFSKYNLMFDRYPSTKTAVAYIKPQDYYDQKPPNPATPGVNGMPLKAVVSTSQAKILGDKLDHIATVQPQTLLGAYLGGLDTGEKKYVKFLTISGTERWAEEDNVQIFDK
jgi:hypothetical protein